MSTEDITDRRHPLFGLSQDQIQRIAQKACDYVRISSGGMPISESDVDDVEKRTMETVYMNKHFPFSECKQDAEEGDIDAMIDVALRLYVGLGTPIDKKLSRSYLEKVIASTEADDEDKASAHAYLIEALGCLSPSSTPALTTLRAAAHHANETARLGFGQTHNVLYFGKLYKPRLLDKNDEELVKILKGCVYVWKAMKERDATMAKEERALLRKRVTKPSRYKCAAVGCEIESTSGKALRRCGGKCEESYKPSYCTPECQKRAWKEHKQFCKSGLSAEFSSSEDIGFKTGSSAGLHFFTSDVDETVGSKKGNVTVPIPRGDGSVVDVSTPGNALHHLKELQALAKEKVGEPVLD